MDESDHYYHRHLPHYIPPNATYFITFRLAGSLPMEVVGLLKDDYAHQREIMKKTVAKDLLQDQLINLRKRFFAKYDALLDCGDGGSDWLKDDAIAALVADAIKYRDQKKYDLIAYTIMPNHVHLVFSLFLENLKWYTAKEANKLLHRAGQQFWQHESYDHVVRNGKELERIIRYVVFNPVKAGLVQNWGDWKWSYSKYEL